MKKKSKQTDMQEHMAKLRAMRGKGGKRKGGKGKHMKALHQEVKTLNKQLGSVTKMLTKMAKKTGIVKSQPRTRKRVQKRR